jgi:anthranilate phosphoribosyltransferase
MKFAEIFEKAYNKTDLTFQECRQSVFAMMEGAWDPAQIGALLTALHMKGETADELAGFAAAMSEKAVLVPHTGKRLMDTCGTGGDRKGSFNISTLVAFVLAGCGIPIAKHGNRAASSSCGSADLLQALGLRYQLQPEEAAAALDRFNFAFLFAPDYHPATKSVAIVRKQLGVPTVFNLLGPLTNPARPAAQIAGVYQLEALPLMVAAAQRMDPQRRALFLHSEEGWDEVTLSCRFYCYSTHEAPAMRAPQEFGFESASTAELHGGTPAENAAIARAILSGERSVRRQTVLLNAVLGYMVYHPHSSLQEARKAVEESLDSSAALNVVQKYRERFPNGS